MSPARPAGAGRLALARLLARPGVTAPIASATSVAQVEELLGAMRLALHAEAVRVLDAASARASFAGSLLPRCHNRGSGAVRCGASASAARRSRMARYRFRGNAPQVHESAFVADGATVIGRVVLHELTSVWPGAVIRADSEPIVVGKGSNVQDCAVLHVDPGVPMTIGENVTVGHQVMLHGCTIGDGSLVGIQAVVLNHARIGRCCVVGAGAVVTEGKAFADYSLIVGAPARVVRSFTPQDFERFTRSAPQYVQLAQRHRAGLRRID